MTTSTNTPNPTSTQQSTPGTTASPADVHLWHTLSFRDADAMMRWLGAVGFIEHATYRDEQDPSLVVHAEWVWRHGGGGLMFGSTRDGSAVHGVGKAAAYVVVPTADDVDATYAAALDAGGSGVREPADQDYGGRNCIVEDPEGNSWSFGSYQPA